MGELQANLPLAEDISLQGSFNGGLLKDLQGDKTFNISDHFFLGGPLNIRGFDTRGIGPSSDGNALGGTLYWASGLHLYGQEKVELVTSSNLMCSLLPETWEIIGFQE